MHPVEPERLPDFTLDGGPGPAVLLSEDAAARLVQRSLDQVYPSSPTRLRLHTLRYHTRLHVRPWLAAAAVLLLAVVPAAAAIWRVVRPPPTPATHSVRPKPARSVSPPIEPTVEPAPEETSEVLPTPPRRKRRVRGKLRRPPAAQPVSDPSATDLLDLASRQRASRDWAAAAATYDRLLAAHPDTGAAYVAQVAGATIALEHLGQPKRAAHGFAAALHARPDGPLHAEARWGLARAWRARGELAREREALEALLRDYPASAYAEVARARLETLEAR